MKKCVCDMVYIVYVCEGQCEREEVSQVRAPGKNVIRFRAFWKMYMPTLFFHKNKTHINQKQITKFIVYNKSCKNLIPKLIFFFFLVSRFQ